MATPIPQRSTRSQAAAAAAAGPSDAEDSQSSTASTISALESRQFDDLTIVQEDSYHQIEKPVVRRKRSREDEELYSYAYSTPPPGKPVRGNSKQFIFYCKKCKYEGSSNTSFKNHLASRHGIYLHTSKRVRVKEEANSLATGFKIQAARAASSIKSLTSQSLREGVNDADWINVLMSMIVNHNLPHTIVEWPEFHLLIKLSNYTLAKGEELSFNIRFYSLII